MDSQNGGLSSEEKQRQAAAEIARRKVLMAYDNQEVQTAANFIKKQDKAIYSSNTSQNGTALNNGQQQGSQGVLGSSATPVLRNVTNEDWKKYHTAWQDYYQKYYSEYYMNAAKEYVAKTQVKQIRQQAAEEEAKKKFGETVEKVAAEESREKQAPAGLKARIRAKAIEKDKASKRRKLTPIIAGLTVVLTILFLQYNRLIFAPIAAYVSPGDSPASEITAVDPTVTLTKVSSENKLIIPKLNVDVPLNFGVDAGDAMSAMNHGVVHYRINGASAYPGEVGNFVVLGHSAGDVYSANQYKFIFSGLERLEDGDIIYVHYDSLRYTYKVVGREIILPTEVEKLTEPKEVPTLLLVTCWPLGTSQKRLVIHAEQISPSVDGAEEQKEVAEKKDDGSELPKNEDTLFERFIKWITGQ